MSTREGNVTILVDWENVCVRQNKFKDFVESIIVFAKQYGRVSMFNIYGKAEIISNICEREASELGCLKCPVYDNGKKNTTDFEILAAMMDIVIRKSPQSPIYDTTLILVSSDGDFLPSCQRMKDVMRVVIIHNRHVDNSDMIRASHKAISINDVMIVNSSSTPTIPTLRPVVFGGSSRVNSNPIIHQTQQDRRNLLTPNFTTWTQSNNEDMFDRLNNPVGALTYVIQLKKFHQPVIGFVKTGQDHSPTFQCTITIERIGSYIETGLSRNESKRKAAIKACRYIYANLNMQVHPSYL